MESSLKKEYGVYVVMPTRKTTDTMHLYYVVRDPKHPTRSVVTVDDFMVGGVCIPGPQKVRSSIGH